jgi:hypothetical protein
LAHAPRPLMIYITNKLSSRLSTMQSTCEVHAGGHEHCRLLGHDAITNVLESSAASISTEEEYNLKTETACPSETMIMISHIHVLNMAATKTYVNYHNKCLFIAKHCCYFPGYKRGTFSGINIQNNVCQCFECKYYALDMNNW